MASSIVALFVEALRDPNGPVATISNLIFSVSVAIVAFLLGLLLRHLLVKRLFHTILDNWVIQTLGMIVIAIALLVGIISGLYIWDSDLLYRIVTFLLTNQKDAAGVWFANFFWSILTVALGLGIARTLKTITVRGLSEKHIDINTRTLIGRTFYIVGMIVTALLVINIWHIGIEIPVTVVGALAVAATVAFQDILKNLVAGLYILLERPFYIGDQVNINTGVVSYTGKVTDIQLRVTKLRLPSGEEVAVPNIMIFGNAIINNTYYGERRATVTMKLPAQGFLLQQTRGYLRNLFKETEEVMDKPEPHIMFTAYEEEKVILTIRFWVASGQHIDVSPVTYKIHELMPEAELTVTEPLG
jgi:small-conductance mechanosensitive channel